MASTELMGREFGPGEVLFREGERGDTLFVIEAGTIRLTREIDGEPTVLEDLGPGDFAGEVAVVRGGPHTTTAVATTATRCIALQGEALETMIASEKEVAIRFIQGLVQRLHVSHEVLSLVGQRDARTRIVMAILRHVESSGEKRPEGVWLQRRLGDIGDEVAVSKGELGEISKVFLKLQLLRIKRDGILVPDVARLYEYARSGDG
ncbi:MAG: Crp/Fnr family transcriptional regulator [Polyangiaceae bacterium]